MSNLAGKIFCTLLCVVLLCALLPPGRAGAVARRHGPGLFSWHAEVLEPEEREKLFSVMGEYGLTELYQYFPARVDAETAASFRVEAAARGITVYLLTGEPEWGLDANGDKMIDEALRSADLGLAGVMMDVETHLTEEWERDADAVLKRYVRAMINTKRFADEAGVELIACIPGNYDVQGSTKRLMRLVRDGSHAVAVMNYKKDREVVSLVKEAHYAYIFRKPLITIYELQKAGKQGLTEENTYHDDGMTAVGRSFETLRSVFSDCELTYAIHYYDALLEVTGS